MARREKKASPSQEETQEEKQQEATVDRIMARGRFSRRADDARIRLRAYELFQERGDSAGDDVADWLRAERECQDGADGDGQVS